MVMQFASPIWLWALSGLILPITIHLLSRKEGRVIRMGSLRYLRESPTAKYKHLRLNEIGLLLLRCLLVMLLVFLLAGARLTWFGPPKPKWLVLEEGIEESQQMKAVIESLEKQGFETRLMASGFPPVSDATFHEPYDNYWSVVRKLTAQSLDSVVVMSFNYQRNFIGPRIAVPANMKWLVSDAEEKGFIAENILMDNDSVWVREGETNRFMTSFETKKARALSLPDSLPVAAAAIDISIVTAEGFAYDEKILLASLKAIQSVTPHKLRVTTNKLHEWDDPPGDVVFWLSNEQPSATTSPITIGYRDCVRQGLPLLIPSAEAVHDCGTLQNVNWVITKRLNEETALKENLVLQLVELILPSKEKDQYDRRVLPESMMWASGNKDEPEAIDESQTGNMDFYLTVFLLLTLLVERTLAFKRDQ